LYSIALKASSYEYKNLVSSIAIVAAFGIGAVIGSPTVTSPVLAQNMTDGNMSAGNLTTG
jgi:hypothetical protein